MPDQDKRYLMLVDDEQNILLALKRELHEWARERKLDVLLAQSAKEGIALLSEHGNAIEMIISDLRMPEMKGSDFLLAVRKTHPEVITLLLTGYSETEEIVKAVSAGIFSYMLKPWDSSYLIGEVTKAYDFRQAKLENERQKARLVESLRYAGELQKAILKPNVPASQGVEFRVTYRPNPQELCSGDYYDVIVAGPDRYLILLGDILASGVQAAMITAILKAVIYPEYVRNVVGKPLSPADFLGWLNQRMQFEFRMTNPVPIDFFAGVLDVRHQSFVYANAGYTHPVHVKPAGPVPLLVSGTSLAVSRSVMYPEQSVRVAPGEALLFHSPGLLHDAQDSSLAAVLSKEGLGPDYHLRILKGLLASSGKPEFGDDVTVITALL